jgi:7,8-dihydroneopterin aldolase/epimerase/oxygenase
MDTIIICDLEVFYHVGVTSEERAKPQRLLISIELTHDFKSAQASDNLTDTIDYAAITERLLRFGDGCHWELIETLAADIAAMILDDFVPQAVTVEIKKFIIPQARHVAVRLTRQRISGKPG